MQWRFSRRARIPDFPKELPWVGGDPASLRALRGKPVLLFFWTFTCASCLRLLPQLRRWKKLYGPLGLTILGIHTPDFAFEGEKKEVEAACEDLRVSFPVLVDTHGQVGQEFGVHAWPRVVILGGDGAIAFEHTGEIDASVLEDALQRALHACGEQDLPPIQAISALAGTRCYRVTPEERLGYLHGRLANGESFVPEEETAFALPSSLPDDIPALAGHWIVHGESVEHARATAISDICAFRYHAFGVSAVLRAPKGAGDLLVRLDGHPLPKDFCGEDVRIRPDGETVVPVRAPRRYMLVHAAVYHHGTLSLLIKDAGVCIFAFGCEGCASVEVR